ncbi:MAG: dethiobiotin synthase, partial [Verrucomicrobiota bacterium]
LAAEMAGTPIDLASIGDAFDTLSQSYEMVIAEGAGGVLVPIDRERTMLDLMKMLQLPVVVAARPALGTLNHTLLTLHRLRAEGLKVLAVVLIESEPMEAGFIEEDNRKTLKEMAGAPVLGPIPFMTDLSPTSFGTTTRPVAEELIDQD